MLKTSEFIISIHDVCPKTSSLILRILDNLNPLVSSTLSIGVVPLPYHKPWKNEDDSFVHELKGRTREILLHGYTHKRKPNKNPFSFLIENSDEFSGLSTHETDHLLGQGQQVIKKRFGQAAKGFVPPGWQPGNITSHILLKHGFNFIITLSRMGTAIGHQVPLAHWSWDCGRMPFSGYLGEAMGSVFWACHRNAIPCIVLHPKDIERGFLTRSLGTIRRFLEKGYQPVTFSTVYQRIESDAH